MSEVPDDIPELLRQAQAKDEASARALLEAFRRSMEAPLAWQKKAGRALAEEGLETDVLTQGIEAWIEREREALREKLRRLL